VIDRHLLVGHTAGDPSKGAHVLENEFLIESEMNSPGVLTMRVVGELDAATADRLCETLGEWPDITECVIDLSDCTFIDSQGVKALLKCRREIGESIPMRLVGLSPDVERVMRLAGVDTYLGLNAPAT
jgi:anti-anti-sigma factor